MRVTIGLAVCVLLVAAEGKDKKGTDPLAGAWKVTSAVARGQERGQLKGTLYTFKDGKLTRKSSRGERKMTYTLDASKKPGTIDMTAVGGDRDGMKIKGIFEVKGDELKLCVSFLPDAERPKQFSGDEEGQALLTLKREKAEGKE
jgi:uncharacterized protein (TIGR03067 family)